MSSRVDKLLAGVSKPPPIAKGHLIFALDATASREKTWDTASQLTAPMFAEAADIGSLSVQLMYYRGVYGFDGECKASSWVDDPLKLIRLMGKVSCQAGKTQIGRVLTHTLHEANRKKIGALVFVGDACEESRDALIQPAMKPSALSVPVFLFQEGHDATARLRFREIAELTHGAHHQFDSGSARQLGELLRAIALFAVGGIKALEQQGSAAARLLLGQIR